jgi:hypothetical protein
MLNLKNLKLWSGSNDIIKFYCIPELEDILIEPKPAIKCLPDWFKIIPPHLPDSKDEFQAPAMTAKKCFPLIDAMSLGYTIVTSGDIRIEVNHDGSAITTHNPPQLICVEWHNVKQIGGQTAPGYPADPIKFINWWIVETAPGWSTLFIPPINHFNPLFTCLGGLVDTDKYPKEVNFPAIWHKTDYEATIPAGTPLVTAIPIKRNSFPKKPVISKITPSKHRHLEKMRRIQSVRSHYYTSELREKK